MGRKTKGSCQWRMDQTKFENEFESGCVTIAAEKNQWLLIDDLIEQTSQGIWGNVWEY